MKRLTRFGIAFLLAAALAGCSSAPSPVADSSAVIGEALPAPSVAPLPMSAGVSLPVNGSSAPRATAGAAGLVPVSFELGRKTFRRGDSITITEVLASSPHLAPGDRVIVRGTYVLASEERAILSISLTTSQQTGPTRVSPTQMMKVRQGEGDFEVSHQINHEGRLHLSLRPETGSAFGDVYFGTAAQMRGMR
jgi:hypothetical protein